MTTIAFAALGAFDFAGETACGDMRIGECAKFSASLDFLLHGLGSFEGNNRLVGIFHPVLGENAVISFALMVDVAWRIFFL